MSRSRKRGTNEWEFQGRVIDWLNEEIRRRPGMGFEKATQEPSKEDPRRNDVVVWFNRAARSVFLTMELKAPSVRITHPGFLHDATKKAQRWSAPFFAIWNMQAAELYKTPDRGKTVTPADRQHYWDPDPAITDVSDWLEHRNEQRLRHRALEILDKAWSQQSRGQPDSVMIDASVFVDFLGERLQQLREAITPALANHTTRNRLARLKLRALAARQGFIDFVDDINAAVAGQYTYRVIGQILFYFALRRKQPSLRPLQIAPEESLPAAFAPFWDDVRRFDYEALFQHTELEDLVPLPPAAQHTLRKLIQEFSNWDWGNLRDDVLGAVFERLLPKEEQQLLGQFYTPARVADLLVAFSVGAGQDSFVLDPGCGSGTFLMRSYDFLKDRTGLSHTELLSKLWGFDISPFASEVAAINLYRQDMSAFSNFPRIVPRDFFDRRIGEQIPFVPARAESGDASLTLPNFDAIIGNPPYLRSQNQDDLDPNYKAKLMGTAKANGIQAEAKTDLFAYFIFKALDFMKPGSRLGFVTSASWLTSIYGLPLQWLLMERLRLVAVISSVAESFFSQVDVNTVLLVAERMEGSTAEWEEPPLRFVTLKRRLEEIFPEGTQYWNDLVRFTDFVESTQSDYEGENARIKLVAPVNERRAISSKPREPRNWSLYLRAPLSFYCIFGEPE